MTSVPLESGASVYVFADVKEAAPILDILPIDELKDKQTKQLMDRTDFFAAGLFPKESGRRFQLVSWGNYPTSGAGMALGMNKNWAKMKSKTGQYWYSAEDKLSIALESKQAFAASWLDDKSDTPVTQLPGIALPETFTEFRKNAPFSLWVNDPGPGINRIFDNREIPFPFQISVQCLFANLFNEEEKDGVKQYRTVIRMQFAEPRQARSIAALFGLARGLLNNSNWLMAKFFFANPHVQEDRNIDVTSGLLTENDISLLLRMILLN
jgi:hypothetical protein